MSDLICSIAPFVSMHTHYFANDWYPSLVWLWLCFTRCQANLKKRQEYYCWFSVGRTRKTICLLYSATRTRISCSCFKNIETHLSWHLQPNSHPDGNYDHSTCFMQLGELFPVLVISCYLNLFSAPNERGIGAERTALKTGKWKRTKQAWGCEYDANHSPSGIGEMQTPGGGVPLELCDSYSRGS